MSDNITLPREVVEKIFDAFSSEVYPLAVSTEWYDIMDALRAALAAPRPEPEKRHPGYIIGNHWLETAYERLCAGEAEDAILEDYEVVREPRLRDLRQDAEKWRRLLEGASIAADADTSTASAAVDASAAPAAAAVDALKEPATEPAIRAREDKT